MATIEMDISEYETLKKYQTQLEDSLKREKELNDEVKKLQDEKLKDFKNAQKQVLITKTTCTHEYVYAKKRPIDIARAITTWEARQHFTSMREDSLDGFFDMFFTREKVETAPTVSYIYKGFEEVAEEYLKSLDTETKRTLKVYQDKIGSLEIQNLEVDRLQNEVSRLKQEVKDKGRIADNQIQAYKKSIEKLETRIGILVNYLNIGYALYSRFLISRSVRKYLKHIKFVIHESSLDIS